MTETELKDRTYRFAVGIILLSRKLPNTLDAREIGRQLIRSGTSVPANYRAACRSRSLREFISRLSVAEEEADECGLWLGLLASTALVPREAVQKLLTEAHELCAIFAASQKTAKARASSKSQSS